MKDKRILFYIPEGNVETNGVYASQVLGLARFCVTLGAKCLIFQHIPKDGVQEDWQPKEVEPGIRVVTDTVKRPYIPFWSLTKAYKRISKGFLGIFKDFSPTHIYCRQYITCRAAHGLSTTLGAKLVFSVRGADVEERLLGNGLKDWVAVAYIRWALKRAIKICDHLNTVSFVFADRLRLKYKRNASVLPCCIPPLAHISQERDAAKGKTIVYSGGLSPWQKIDDILALMKAMSKIDDTLQFKFLTKDIDSLKDKCQKIGLPIDRWTAKACKPSEVVGELSKADCGIIMRDNTVVNQVASPIKIGEYLQAGLGIIASPCIGDVGRLLAEECFAKMYTGEESIQSLVDFVKSLNNDARIAAQCFVQKHYTYEGNRAAVMEMFK